MNGGNVRTQCVAIVVQVIVKKSRSNCNATIVCFQEGTIYGATYTCICKKVLSFWQYTHGVLHWFSWPRDTLLCVSIDC